MKIVVVRESDQETFEFAPVALGPFALDRATRLPGGTSMDVSGYEYSGKDGGYQTSGRVQRRPFTLLFDIREDRTTTLGLFDFIREASGFFIPKDSNLDLLLYSVQVYTDDRVNSSYQMRNGTISVPLNSETQLGECNAKAQISFIFGDPYLYPIGDSGLSFELFAGGQSSDQGGRRWDDTDDALWDVSDGKIWELGGGSGDPVAVDVITVAPVPVSIVTSGELVSPQIFNLTNGSSFKYNGTLSAIDVLTVDILGNVLVNGETPSFTYSGTLTASNGTNTFALLAAPGSPGSVTLTILGAF